jgi:enoyl-CoA hydratase/carnithine racemase
VGARPFGTRKPVIGAIPGATFGGGLGLALLPYCPIAAPSAGFAANFVKLGIHQGFGLSHTLARLVGAQQATLLLYTGRRLNAEQALAIGLVDAIAPLDGLREAATQLAAEIAENAPLAVMSVRATMRAGIAEAVAAATEHELKEQQWLRGTEDAEEGIRSVAERRPGNFKGR